MKWAPLLLLASACDLDPLVGYCESMDCIPAGVERVCQMGRWDCEKSECVGAVLPQEEVCDGLDNDCSGLADDGVLPVSPGDIEYICSGFSVGICSHPLQKCIGGQWVCDVHPAVESCNGLDDDCDGETDEGLTSYFYDEGLHPSSVGVGWCSPGVRRCVNGEIVESQPRYPGSEVCDRIDNDCDGETDEGLGGGPASVLIVLDTSSSMTEHESLIYSTVCLTTQADAWFALALVADGSVPRPFVSLTTPWLRPSEMCTWLQVVEPIGSNIGEEYMADGIELGRNAGWPADTERRFVVAITDETLQAFDESLFDARQKIIDSCFGAPFRLAVYTEPQFFGEWSLLMPLCDGWVEDIDNVGGFPARIFEACE